jgi:hypothetical protein
MSALAVNWFSATMSPATPTNATVEIRAPQLSHVVSVFSAPWLPSVLEELRTLEKSGQNIPGVGDLTIAESTADHLRRLMTLGPVAQLPEPTLVPFSGGGLSLTWNLGQRELSFSTYPGHDDFVYMRTGDNDQVAADGILTLKQTRELGEQIAAFLASPHR